MQDRLYRSASERVLAGLCGGLADRYDLDPALVRLVWVVVDVFTGVFPLLLVYIVMAMIVPEEPPVGTSGEGSSWNGPQWRPGAPSGPGGPAAMSEGGAPEAAQSPAPGAHGARVADAPSEGAGSQGAAAPSPAGAAQPSGSWGPWGPPPPIGSDWRTVRAYERAQRRAQRAAWRQERRGGGPSAGGLIVGVILVLVGGVFLLRQMVPTLDTDVLWPLVLIVVGALLLAGAFRR
ncbi:MAG: PspC domain-containing protein [Candidatus Limnocylindrales bacterium]